MDFLDLFSPQGRANRAWYFWHILLFLVPIYNLYLGLVLLFQRGTWGWNEYGPDPLASGGPAGYIED